MIAPNTPRPRKRSVKPPKTYPDHDMERERVGARPLKNIVVRVDDYEALVLLATDCQSWIQTAAHVLNPSPLQRRGLELLERFK